MQSLQEACRVVVINAMGLEHAGEQANQLPLPLQLQTAISRLSLTQDFDFSGWYLDYHASFPQHLHHDDHQVHPVRCILDGQVYLVAVRKTLADESLMRTCSSENAFLGIIPSSSDPKAQVDSYSADHHRTFSKNSSDSRQTGCLRYPNIEVTCSSRSNYAAVPAKKRCHTPIESDIMRSQGASSHREISSRSVPSQAHHSACNVDTEPTIKNSACTQCYLNPRLVDTVLTTSQAQWWRSVRCPAVMKCYRSGRHCDDRGQMWEFDVLEAPMVCRYGTANGDHLINGTRNVYSDDGDYSNKSHGHQDNGNAISGIGRLGYHDNETSIEAFGDSSIKGGYNICHDVSSCRIRGGVRTEEFELGANSADISCKHKVVGCSQASENYRSRTKIHRSPICRTETGCLQSISDSRSCSRVTDCTGFKQPILPTTYCPQHHLGAGMSCYHNTPASFRNITRDTCTCKHCLHRCCSSPVNVNGCLPIDMLEMCPATGLLQRVLCADGCVKLENALLYMNGEASSIGG